jgi:transketolase
MDCEGGMDLRELRKFQAKDLNGSQLAEISRLAKKARCDVLEMITFSGSSHPGGALSSTDIYILLWLCANMGPDMAMNPGRDRIVVSHGHTSAAVYLWRVRFQRQALFLSLRTLEFLGSMRFMGSTV